MKVTLDIADEQWAKLREKAAAAGYDGPAELVGEALEGYLERSDGPSGFEGQQHEHDWDSRETGGEGKAAWSAMKFVVREMRRNPAVVEEAINDFCSNGEGQSDALNAQIQELPQRWRNSLRTYAIHLREEPADRGPDDGGTIERLATILSLPGSISDEEAEAWKANIRELRSTWR